MLKMEDFIRGGGKRRAKETEHEGNGETKRLKGNRTSKRSTKRKKARKGERSLCVCVWREGRGSWTIQSSHRKLGQRQ